MREDSEAEGQRWIRQAADDLKYARVLLREGGYALTCFISQQVSEKALKALLYSRGEELVTGHSVKVLGTWCSRYDRSIAPVIEKAKKLDAYYIPTRYPNGLPGGSPFEVFTRDQAREAVRLAGLVLRTCRRKLVR